MDTDDDFDWQPLGKGWWFEKKEDVGADERQLRFACARHRGCSQTESARLGGYPDDGQGSIRQAGWRVARTRVVTTLLSLAVAEAKGGVDGCVDAAEARRILTRLARGSDPSIKIRALEALSKLDATDLEREQAERASKFDPIETLDTLATHSPVLAAVLAVQNHLPWPSKVSRHNAEREIAGIWELILKNTADPAVKPADAQEGDRFEAAAAT